MIITVVGMGKIGLPLAAQFASKGHKVLGADVNPKVVEQINSGVVPFPGEHTLQERMTEAIEKGLLTATINTSDAVSKSDAVVVVVPLFVDDLGTPDFKWMDSATKEISKGLRPGTLISYETTLPVGTTRKRFGPMLELGSNLKADNDFYLVFSPERVRTGRVFEDLRKYPKLIGGVGEESAKRGVEFYRSVLDFDDRPDLAKPNGVWDLGSCEASEMSKLAETTYRDVNIGLANQFAIFAEKNGFDVYSVIEACNSQFYSHIHQPGIAVGGHCIPIYPQMYLWNDPEATIVSAARASNKHMPLHAIQMLESEIGNLKGISVAILGASYRSGVKEIAFSGVFDLVNLLKEREAIPLVHDYMYSQTELENFGFRVFRLGESVDAAIIQTDYPEYNLLGSAELPKVKVIIDGRNIFEVKPESEIKVKTIGKSS